MKLLIGTNNQNKLNECRRILAMLKSEIELLSLSDLNITNSVEEDSEDILVNAKKKAEFYGHKSGLLTLADDTGLFIDALDGEPGMHSRRWHEGTDKDRYLKILERMKGVPEAERTCRYKGALAVYNPAIAHFWTYEQNLEGYIAEKPIEGFGFGYDPIFIITDSGRYYSTYTDEERAAISHRGQGIREYIKTFR